MDGRERHKGGHAVTDSLCQDERPTQRVRDEILKTTTKKIKFKEEKDYGSTAQYAGDQRQQTAQLSNRFTG